MDRSDSAELSCPDLDLNKLSATIIKRINNNTNGYYNAHGTTIKVFTHLILEQNIYHNFHRSIALLVFDTIQ